MGLWDGAERSCAGGYVGAGRAIKLDKLPFAASCTVGATCSGIMIRSCGICHAWGRAAGD